MAIDKLDRFATNSGVRDRTTLNDATGVVAGQQLTEKEINEFWGENIDKINEVIEVGPSGFEEDSGSTAAIQQLFLPGGAESWSSPMNTGNVYTAAAGALYVGLEAHINSDNERKLLVLRANNTVDVIDAATMTLDSNNSLNVAGTLPAPTGAWNAECCCSDGTTLYCSFADSVSNAHQIQAYDISTWTPKVGWPATGTALSGTGALTNSYDMQMRVVSTTEIGITQPWVTITAATSDAVTIMLMSNGTLPVNAGAGSAGAGNANELTSDGTKVYFTDRANATVHNLDLSNPEAVPALAAYAGVTTCMGLQWFGDKWCTTSTGANTFVWGSDTEQVIAISQTGDTEVVEQTGRMVFDGLSLWARAYVLVSPGNSKPAIVKFKPNIACYITSGSSNVTTAAENLVEEVLICDYANAPTNDYWLMSPMCFDGRDVYMVGDMRAAPAAALGGSVYRVPKAVLR